MEINNCKAYELIRREELGGIKSTGYLFETQEERCQSGTSLK